MTNNSWNGGQPLCSTYEIHMGIGHGHGQVWGHEMFHDDIIVIINVSDQNYQNFVKDNQFIMCMIKSIHSYTISVDHTESALIVAMQNCWSYTKIIPPNGRVLDLVISITLWLSILSCVVNISREETLWVDRRDTHDPMPHTQVARKKRRVLCLGMHFSLISFQA